MDIGARIPDIRLICAEQTRYLSGKCQSDDSGAVDTPRPMMTPSVTEIRNVKHPDIEAGMMLLYNARFLVSVMLPSLIIQYAG